MNRRFTGKSGWNFDHRLVDEHGDGIEIVGMGDESESLRLEWNRSAAGKWVEKFDRFCSHRVFDFAPRGFEDVWIVGIFPFDEFFANREKAGALAGLVGLGGESIGMRAWIVDERRPKDGARSG